MFTYQDDYSEVRQILLALYQNSGESAHGEHVIDMLTISTGDDYLDERGADLRKRLLADSEIISALAGIDTDYCTQHKCAVCPLSKYCNAHAKELQENYDINAPVMIDLFCGAGGLSLGFTQEGFITSLANDIEVAMTDSVSSGIRSVRSCMSMTDMETGGRYMKQNSC